MEREDEIYLSLMSDGIGEMHDENGNITPSYAIRLTWLKDNTPYDFHVSQTDDGFTYYIVNQRDWRSIVAKKGGFKDSEAATRAAILRIMTLINIKR